MLLEDVGNMNRKRGRRCFGEEEEDDDMVGLQRGGGNKGKQQRCQDNNVVLVDQTTCCSKYGDGVAWCRGSMIGKGSFGSVYLATLKNPKSRYSSFPSVMAVKSAEVSVSGSIQKEREVLNNVKGCSNVIRCYGEETTHGESGEMVYNLLLEYGSGGTLADVIEKSGSNGLSEFEVRCYTRSILRGLCHIHDRGYVHCDLKPENILLVENTRKGASAEFRAKIGDLGLAKRDNPSKKRKLDPYWRGTPMYLSPEAVVDGLQGPPCDVWALGCIVLEMLTGKPPWDGKEDLDATEILRRIGEGNELPDIPSSISKEGRSFLKGCFVRKSMYRLTAEMLLDHPFLEGLVDDDDEVEEVEEVLDINEISSMLVMSETDDDEELYCSDFSDDWSYVSEEELFSSWSEEDADDIDNQVGPSFREDGTFQVQEGRDVTSNAVQQYPITFTISAGV